MLRGPRDQSFKFGFKLVTTRVGSRLWTLLVAMDLMCPQETK